MIDFTAVSDAWSATLWRASWQGGLLAMAVWAVCRLLPVIPARFQSWLWRLVILKFLVALIWTIPFEVPLLPAVKPATVQLIAAPSTSLQVEDIPFTQQPPRPPSPWLIPLIVWAVVVGWLLVRIGIRCRDANLMRHRSRPIGNQTLLDQLATVCKSFGLQRTPRLLEMDGNGSPMLVGILRPAIVIPATTLSRLDHFERAMVIAHELAHARRGDLFWNLMAALVRTAFFFHPLLWLTERRLRLTQEIAADELAIALQRNDPVSYGNLLVSIVSKLGPEQLLPTVSVGTVGSQESLKERLVAMRFIKPASVRATISCGMLLVAVGVLGVVPWTVVAAEPSEKIDQPKTTPDASIPQRIEAVQTLLNIQKRIEAVQTLLNIQKFEAAPKAVKTGWSTPSTAPAAGFKAGGNKLFVAVQAESEASLQLAMVQAERDVAQVKAKHCEENLGRMQSHAGSVTAIELDEAKYQVELAKLNVKVADIRVEQAKLALERAAKKPSAER